MKRCKTPCSDHAGTCVAQCPHLKTRRWRQRTCDFILRAWPIMPRYAQRWVFMNDDKRALDPTWWGRR